MKNSKGFTMVELVVTIAIIAILATTVSLSVSAVVKSSKKKSQQAEVESAYATCGAVFTELNSGFSTISLDQLDNVLEQRIGSNIVLVKRLDNSNKNADTFTQDNIQNVKDGYYIYYRYGEITKEGGNQYYIDTLYYIVEGDIWKFALTSNKAGLNIAGSNNIPTVYTTKLYYNGTEVSVD